MNWRTKVLIGLAIVCGLIAVFSTVMIFLRTEQWFEFLLIAGFGYIAAFIMLLTASVTLEESERR